MNTPQIFSHERRGKDSFGSSEKSCSIGFEDDEGGEIMEITIKATPEEIAKLLQAIGSSKEHTKRKHPESKIEYDPQTGEGKLIPQNK